MADDVRNSTDPPEPDSYDWTGIVEGLERYLRLRSIPVGMKLFETEAEMERVERLRRPQASHTFDQIVAQARWMRWTVGITNADLAAAQCGAVLGLRPQDQQWRSGERMAGVWYETKDDAAAHQAALDVVPHGRYEAVAVSPLALGRLDPPDVCLIYATPGQMIILNQRSPVLGLSQVQLHLRGRERLRRFLGPRSHDGTAIRFDPVLRRAQFWRRGRRRAVDGDSPALSAESRRGIGASS